MIINFKIFEKLDIPPVDLKKFVMWKSENSRYSILELLSIDNVKHVVILKRFFLYNVDTDIEYDISTSDNIYDYSPSYVKKNIVFESDNEQDCFDFLQTLIDAKKYNL